MKTAACKTSVNTGDSSGFATQIVVLNVDGSSPSGHPLKEIPVSQALTGIFSFRNFQF